MILRMARWATRSLHQPSAEELLPYDMFDAARTEQEAKIARTLERIYHKGQDKAWDGKEVLEELLEKHGGIQLDDKLKAPMCRMFAIILWGELAAWKVSAALALDIEDLEAKMAATSQAHDEARHFYVMHDYLKLIGYEPTRLPAGGDRILHQILSADSLAKKLLGMQLMVEPVALTLFQITRERNFDPVLSDLLQLFEVDEARHLALGVQHLPVLLAKMNKIEIIDFYLWQLRLFMHQMDAVHEMLPSFEALDIDPKEVIRLGELKQLHVGRMLIDQVGIDLPIEEIMARILEFRIILDFPDPSVRETRLATWRRAVEALIYSSEAAREVQRNLDRLQGSKDLNVSVA
jgi:hypothetical protein